MTADSAVIVLANPAAGAGRAVRRAADFTGALHGHGVQARLVVPASAEDAARTVRDLAPMASAMIACGGDGTANMVMNACLEAGAAFGLLPAGTGDDNARSLRVPADPLRAASIVAADLRVQDPAGAVGGRPIDVAMATCADGTARAFLGVMSTGIDSTVNERANAYTRLPGTARYLAALAAELRGLTPVPYTVTVDDTVVESPALLASIGNGPAYGGGMRVCPDAMVDDGLLDVTMLRHVSRTTFLRVFPRVFRGTHVRHPAVVTLRGTRVTVAAQGAIAYADGERFGPLPVTVSVRQKALRLVGVPTA